MSIIQGPLPIRPPSASAAAATRKDPVHLANGPVSGVCQTGGLAVDYAYLTRLFRYFSGSSWASVTQVSQQMLINVFL